MLWIDNVGGTQTPSFSRCRTGVADLSCLQGIAWTYIRFYNGAAVQGVHRELFPYHGRLQPFAAWYALIGCCIILVFNGFRSFGESNTSASVHVRRLIMTRLYSSWTLGHSTVCYQLSAALPISSKWTRPLFLSAG